MVQTKRVVVDEAQYLPKMVSKRENFRLNEHLTDQSERYAGSFRIRQLWGQPMTSIGAFFEGLGTAIAAMDPLFSLIVGIALGAIATLGVLRWPWSLGASSASTKADPLSNLFAGDTLDDQLARVADPKAFDERKDREASAIRAKIFAHRSAKRPAAQVPPHRAERFNHAAVLDHIAKVMRAGTQDDSQPAQTSANQGEWEEVLLLPAPDEGPNEKAKAA